MCRGRGVWLAGRACSHIYHPRNGGEGLPHVAHWSRVDTGIGSRVRRDRGAERIKSNGLSNEFLDPANTVRVLGPHAAARIPLKKSEKFNHGSERVSDSR